MPQTITRAHRHHWRKSDIVVGVAVSSPDAGVRLLTISPIISIGTRATKTIVLWWMAMLTHGPTALRLAAAVAACSALAAIGLAPASAAPSADRQGYVDSTARCASPSETVVFGRTETSRVAICGSDGDLQYRGVRLRDGAKLIVAASQSGDEYTAKNDGITYTVTEDSLVVSAGTRVIREESMIDFHGSQQTDVPAASPAETPTPTTPLPPPLPAEVGGGGN
jgi:hypothetical protein